MNSFEGNIHRLIAIRGLLFSWVTIPTLALFYIDRGLSLSDLIVFKSILSATGLVCEVPSGYLADVWGRKKTSLLGCFFWILSVLLYISGNHYWQFLGAEVLLGVAAALLSGVDSALAYDSLLAVGKVDQYQKAESRMSSVSGISEACGGLIGAFLASYDLLFPFYLQLVLVVTSFFIMLTLKEPPRLQRGFSEVSAWRGIIKTVSYVLKEDRGLQALTIFYSISASGTLLLVWLAQGYMKAIEIPTAYYGVVWAALHFTMAYGSSIAHRLDAHFGSQRALVAMVVVTVSSYLVLGTTTSLYGMIGFLLLYAVRGVRSPLFRYYVNRIVPSEVRATVLSVQGLGVRAVTLVAGPVVAMVVSSISLSAAFIGIGFISLGVFLYALKRIEATGVLEEQYKSSFAKLGSAY